MPGQYDPTRATKSQYLKEGTTFPVLNSDPELASLGRKLGKMLGELHTSLYLGKEWTHMVRLVPDSGTLQEGVDWLLPYIKQFDCVSFDTESCTDTQRRTFAIFGTMTGYVLIVDLRGFSDSVFPKELWPLIEGHLVLGSQIHEDARVLARLQYKAGEIQRLSRAIQDHQLYPYCTPEPCNKPGLKFIPEMVYGHHYGPLRLKKSTGKRAGFTQPFDWPEWGHPCRMYQFGRGRPKQEQIAYMKNDGTSPFIHVILYTMLEVANGKVLPSCSVFEALNLVSGRFFKVRGMNDRPATPSHAPDVWAECGGVAPGSSDTAIRECLRDKSQHTLRRLVNYIDLDIDDADDRLFIDLYGGLSTVSRCAKIVKEDFMLWDSGVEVDRAEHPTGAQPASNAAAACPTGQNELRKATSDQSIGDGSTSSAATKRGKKVPRNSQKRSRTPSPKPLETISFKAKHSHDHRCKRQRLTVDMWKCPNRPYMLAKIPFKSKPLRKSEVGKASPRASETAVRSAQDRQDSSSTSSSSSSSSSDSSSSDDSSEEDSPASPEPKPKRCIQPHEVPHDSVLRLLAGKLEEVDLPEDFVIPSRFTGTPDFGPRCYQCGHRDKGSSRQSAGHPVDACPVVGQYGREAFTPAEGSWISKPCLYPLCSRPAHHFTKMCPELHSFCLQCGFRGHSASRCDLVQSEYPAGTRSDAYEVFAPFGMKSRKAKTIQDWSYSPKLPLFRKVCSKKRTYLMPWTAEKVEAFEQLGFEERRHQAQAELYC